MTEQTLQSHAYRNFLIHIRNSQTRTNYEGRLRKYLQYCQTDSYDDLLYGADIQKIQGRIEDFLVHIQNPDYHIRPGTVAYYLVAIRFFYTMNDIVLNWKKIAKVLPAPRKATEDRPYTVAEISKLLEKCDQRGRCCILLMCSSGMREGAIAPIKLAHIQRMDEIYKISVYRTTQKNIRHSAAQNVPKQSTITYPIDKDMVKPCIHLLLLSVRYSTKSIQSIRLNLNRWGLEVLRTLSTGL